MKPLYKNKKYDLSQLNDEQLQAVLNWLKDNDKGWENRSIEVFKPSYLSHPLAFFDPDFKIFGGIDATCTNALELFDEEMPLKGSVTVKTEVTKNIAFKKELPNINFTQDESVYDDMLSLIEKGKQHGLKIVVTFEKL